MAERTAKPAGGNFNAATTWEPEGVPTASDDLFLKATSGNVTINASVTCRSLNLTGYTGELKHEGFNLNINSSTTPPESKALVFPSTGWTYTITSATLSKIAFGSTGTVVVTADFGGKTVGVVEVNRTGAGGGVKLLSGYTQGATSTTLLTQGIFDTNGQALTLGIFNSNNSNTRELKLGNSAITVAGTPTPWSCGTATGLTVVANTATVTLTGASAEFLGSSTNWNGLTLKITGSGTANVSAAGGTLGNLIREATAVKADTINLATGKMTVTGKVTFKGNSIINRLFVRCVNLGNTAILSGAEALLENVDFMDVKAEGAATWSGTSIGNALGNTGITFTAPVTRYGKVASLWSSTATWSATSGGVAGVSVPLCHDTVILDSNAGAGTYTIDMPRACADLTVESGFIRTLTQSTTTSIFGSMIWASTMATPGIASTHVFRGRGSHLITNAGKARTTIIIEAPGGTYKLTDEMKLGTTGNLNLTLTAGTFDTNGFKVEFGRLTSTGTLTRTLEGRTSTFISASTEALTVNLSTASVTPNLSEATFIFSGKFAAFVEVLGLGGVERSFGTVEFTNSEAEAQVTNGSVTFGKLVLKPGGKYRFTTGITTILTAAGLVINSESGKLVTITSPTEGSKWHLNIASGVVSEDYLSLQDSKAEGGATFYAGNNSTNVSGNEGWSFTPAPYVDSGTGSISVSGRSTESYGGVETGSGTISLTGVAKEASTHTGSGSGVLTTTGKASEAAIRSDFGTGQIQVTGTSQDVAGYLDHQEGALVFSGSGIDHHEEGEVEPVSDATYHGHGVGAYDGTGAATYHGHGTGTYDD